MLRGVVMAVLAIAFGAVASSAAVGSTEAHLAQGVRPLHTALFDPWAFSGGEQTTAFAKARAAGSSYVRLSVMWSQIAPAKKPSGFVPSNPSSPGYSWSGIDNEVTNAEAAGLRPILDVGGPPTWALAKRRRLGNGGTPRGRDLAAFAKALATRYDGKHGQPAVDVYQLWNEPNLSLDLSPVSAATYRSMTNTFAASVHAVSRANLVVAGGLDPFGHRQTKRTRWYSEAPLTYMRQLLCVSGGAHPHSTCSTRIHFDVWAHHPYSFNGPFGHATRPDDVSIADLPKMRAVLQAAIRFHHIVATHPVQFWVTEISWDTNPPRPRAVPLGLQARWTAEALHQMWLSGVSVVTWYMLEDLRRPSVYQSGLYFHSSSLDGAKAKPTLTAFRFPFVAYLHHGTVSVWGRDPASTKARVTIQLGAGKRWHTVASIQTNAYGVFLGKLKLHATAKESLRATVAGSGTSLPFSLGVPKNEHGRYGPWGN